MKSYIIKALWPAFLLASILEVLVFAFVDPAQLQWLSTDLSLTRHSIYSFAFFAFWAVSLIGCAFSVLLAQPADALNSQVV